MIVGTLGEPGQGRPQPGEVGNWSGFVALLKSGAMTTAPEFAENATMNQRLSSLLSSLGEVTVMPCLAAVALMSAVQFSAQLGLAQTKKSCCLIEVALTCLRAALWCLPLHPPQL